MQGHCRGESRAGGGRPSRVSNAQRAEIGPTVANAVTGCSTVSGIRCTCESGALPAVNLGDDADTTSAVYGQIAGAAYGERAIPASWGDRLAFHATIRVVSPGSTPARSTNVPRSSVVTW